MKVHVVGAGPAGSITAISAIRSGFDVVVSEEHQVAGIPENCSGLFSKDGLHSLRKFVEYKKLIKNQIMGADIHLADQKLSIRTKNAVAYVCDRSALDQMLAEKAISEGAQLRYGERVRDHFHANNIVGADGPISAVARHFSFPKIANYVATLHGMADFRCTDPGIVEVFLSNSRFPGFFGWIIPHDEYTAQVGVGVELPNRVQDAWNAILKMKNPRRAARPGGAIIPVEVRPRTAMRIGRKNILLAGDAAGQVKSTTGGGVIFGSSCAVLAGKYASQPLRYEFEWRARHGTDLAMHRLLHDHLAACPDQELSRLGRRLKKLNFDDYLSRKGHMDRPTRMLGPELAVHILKIITGVS